MLSSPISDTVQCIHNIFKVLMESHSAFVRVIFQEEPRVFKQTATYPIKEAFGEDKQVKFQAPASFIHICENANSTHLI